MIRIDLNKKLSKFQDGPALVKHQDISNLNKSDIVLPGRRNIHTGQYVKPEEGKDIFQTAGQFIDRNIVQPIEEVATDVLTYVPDAKQEISELQTSKGQTEIINAIKNNPSLTLQEAIDQAGYGKASQLMGLAQYAPFGEQYLPEEAIEFSRLRDHTALDLLNDDWFKETYGDEIQSAFEQSGLGETISEGVGQAFEKGREKLSSLATSMTDLLSPKPSVANKQGGGKTKYVGETEQGGYTVGVDVDRGDRQRSKSFSLEPSGDVSYSRSVSTPQSSRTKVIDILDGKGTKTITRTRGGETTERTKTLGEKRAERLRNKYERKVNRVFTDPFPEVPNPNEGKFIYQFNQGGRLKLDLEKRLGVDIDKLDPLPIATNPKSRKFFQENPLAAIAYGTNPFRTAGSTRNMG